MAHHEMPSGIESRAELGSHARREPTHPLLCCCFLISNELHLPWQLAPFCKRDRRFQVIQAPLHVSITRVFMTILLITEFYCMHSMSLQRFAPILWSSAEMEFANNWQGRWWSQIVSFFPANLLLGYRTAHMSGDQSLRLVEWMKLIPELCKMFSHLRRGWRSGPSASAHKPHKVYNPITDNAPITDK